MRRHLLTIALILIFVVGLSVLLYPAVSDYINSLSRSRVIAGYYEQMGDLGEGKEAELMKARLYNQKLRAKQDRYEISDEEMKEYESLLNVTGDGVMGMLLIDSIDVRLPIYHGTSEGVLAVGVGHLESSSLPVGGLGTHTAVSGHRGLPSSTLLSDLDKMVMGDTFELHILDEVLAYQVDQILVVEPDEIKALAIAPNMDFCTLVTCTPYGINTHRLLVRGRRFAHADAGTEDTSRIPSEARMIDRMYVVIVLLSPVLIMLNIRLKRRHGKIYGKRENRS